MTTRKSSRPRRRFRDLGELARQANHVVAAGVIVFIASILLQFVLARHFLQAAIWIHGHWGTAGAALLGPLLTDGCTTLVLLAIAFPFGRVTAARPWPAGVALVLLVHGFWLSFHFVVGEHVLLWGHLLPALGRSILIVLTLLGVVRLLRWGRTVALVADGVGKRGEGSQKAGAQGAKPEGDEETVDPIETPGKLDQEGSQEGIEECKAPPPGDVPGGER